jgi:hypothetical protein
MTNEHDHDTDRDAVFCELVPMRTHKLSPGEAPLHDHSGGSGV